MSEKLIKTAQKRYSNSELDKLPKSLQRNSLNYYYLSVYPGLKAMSDLGEDSLPQYPDLIKSAYLHIPFCSGVCDFCSYFLRAIDKEKTSPIDDYLELVKKEILFHQKQADIELSYLYMGGGTPSLIAPKTLEGFFSFLRSNGLLASALLGTLEIHPEFFEDEVRAQQFVAILKEQGVNRVSVGYQSADNSVLEQTNRRHDTHFLADAIAFLREQGMLINLDLMYGLSGLSLEDWERSLKEAVSMNPDSISTYFLFVTPGTVTRYEVNQGKITLPSHKLLQTQHIMAQEYLEKAGFWELPSDFYAKVDGNPAEFRQTMLPSDGGSLPLGAGSYGYYNNVQFYNQFSLSGYRKSVLNGVSPVWKGYHLDRTSSLHRDIMFTFKNDPSLERKLFENKYGEDPVAMLEPIFDILTSYDLAEIQPERIRLTPKGRLMVEEICMLFRDPRIKDQDISKLSESERNKLNKHNFSPTYPIFRK